MQDSYYYKYLKYRSILHDSEVDIKTYNFQIENIRTFIERGEQVGIIVVDLDTRYEELNGWELYDSKRYTIALILKEFTAKYKKSILTLLNVRSGTFIIFFPFNLNKDFEKFIVKFNKHFSEYLDKDIFNNQYINFSDGIIPLNKNLRIERLINCSIFEVLSRIELKREKAVIENEKTLVKLIDEREIDVFFQPIIDIEKNEILAIEVLSRPRFAFFANSDILFGENANYSKYYDLEMLCFRKAINKIKGVAKKFRYSLNFSSDFVMYHLINNDTMKEIIERTSLLPSQFIIEITERKQIKDLYGFKEIIRKLKDFGFAVAIDDVGSGYSSLNLISEIKPDFIKYDIDLIRDIYKIPIKQQLLKSISSFAKEQNLTLIAEGVENKDELDKVREIGVKYVQGYFLERPAESLEKFIKDYA
jgi:EAL domain-containing protein (putative c-di-GMP-specific phosphodiesterase class I)